MVVVIVKYIFGVVNSRRFGASLGIDLSPDFKQCNFDCLYCELDKAKPVSKMIDEPNPEDIVEEVKEYLKKHNYPDVITITANGEPTLYSQLNKLIELLNSLKGKSKLLILTNGSTIHREDIQEALLKLDMVKVSLDAVSEKIFKKVDRPIQNISVKNVIDGLIEFRKKFKGELIIEILVVKNVNDTEENMLELRDVLRLIKPDRVDLGTVDRPPAYRVEPVSDEKLLELGEFLKDFNLNILFRRNLDFSNPNLEEDEILEILKRRPLSIDDLTELTDSITKEKILDRVYKNELKLVNVGGRDYILNR